MPPRRQGLPYAFGKLGMRAKVYATLPVWKMGQMAVYDAYLSRTHEGNFHAFDLDDVDAAFARFKTLKFSQHLTFSVSETSHTQQQQQQPALPLPLVQTTGTGWSQQWYSSAQHRML